MPTGGPKTQNCAESSTQKTSGRKTKTVIFWPKHHVKDRIMCSYVIIMYPNMGKSNLWSYKVITRYPHSPCRNNQNYRHNNYKKMLFQDFPGGMVDKNPPADARDMSLIPAPGRFHMLQATKAHVPQLLSPRATATEAPTLRDCALQQEKPLQREAHAP